MKWRELKEEESNLSEALRSCLFVCFHFYLWSGSGWCFCFLETGSHVAQYGLQLMIWRTVLCYLARSPTPHLRVCSRDSIPKPCPSLSLYILVKHPPLRPCLKTKSKQRSGNEYAGERRLSNQSIGSLTDAAFEWLSCWSWFLGDGASLEWAMLL